VRPSVETALGGQDGGYQRGLRAAVAASGLSQDQQTTLTACIGLRANPHVATAGFTGAFNAQKDLNAKQGINALAAALCTPGKGESITAPQYFAPDGTVRPSVETALGGQSAGYQKGLRAAVAASGLSQDQQTTLTACIGVKRTKPTGATLAGVPTSGIGSSVSLPGASAAPVRPPGRRLVPLLPRGPATSQVSGSEGGVVKRTAEEAFGESGRLGQAPPSYRESNTGTEYSYGLVGLFWQQSDTGLPSLLAEVSAGARPAYPYSDDVQVYDSRSGVETYQSASEILDRLLFLSDNPNPAQLSLQHARLHALLLDPDAKKNINVTDQVEMLSIGPPVIMRGKVEEQPLETLGSAHQEAGIPAYAGFQDKNESRRSASLLPPYESLPIFFV
jgi:hypothetical protein